MNFIYLAYVEKLQKTQTSCMSASCALNAVFGISQSHVTDKLAGSIVSSLHAKPATFSLLPNELLASIVEKLATFPSSDKDLNNYLLLIQHSPSPVKSISFGSSY